MQIWREGLPPRTASRSSSRPCAEAAPHMPMHHPRPPRQRRVLTMRCCSGTMVVDALVLVLVGRLLQLRQAVQVPHGLVLLQRRSHRQLQLLVAHGRVQQLLVLCVRPRQPSARRTLHRSSRAAVPWPPPRLRRRRHHRGLLQMAHSSSSSSKVLFPPLCSALARLARRHPVVGHLAPQQQPQPLPVTPALLLATAARCLAAWSCHQPLQHGAAPRWPRSMAMRTSR